MNPRLWRTAIHEAGHAVVARVLSVSIREVTIIPSEGFLGRCPIYLGDIYRAGYVIALMAGREAELEIFGSTAGDDKIDREGIAQAARCRTNFHEARFRR